MTLVSSKNPFTGQWAFQNPVFDPDQYRNRRGVMLQKPGEASVANPRLSQPGVFLGGNHHHGLPAVFR